jgi:phosphoribosylanthranilate isomerase
MTELATPHSHFIKICGLTNPADADLAIAAGADAIGVNLFTGSKRFVALDACRPWLEALDGKTTRVAVVVNPKAPDLAEIQKAGCFDAIQFHGDESPAFCAEAGFSLWIKAIRVKDQTSLEAALAYSTPNLLLDSWSQAGYGGTGVRLDWDVAREFILLAPTKKILLAGGLNPSNVRDALRIARPFGADVASGVEINPRRKDEYLIREFIKAARSVKTPVF